MDNEEGKIEVEELEPTKPPYVLIMVNGKIVLLLDEEQKTDILSIDEESKLKFFVSKASDEEIDALIKQYEEEKGGEQHEESN